MAHSNHTNGKVKSSTMTVPVSPQASDTDKTIEDESVTSSVNGNAVQVDPADFIETHEAYLDNTVKEPSGRNPWQALSLRTKATFLAVAIGTLPLLGIGTIAYQFANQTLVKQVKQEKQERATEIADKVNRFMFERYADIQIMSDLLRNVSDLRLRKVTSPQEQEARLNHFIEVYKFYDSIALFDLNGNVIIQSQEKVSPNIKDRRYFQAVIKTDRAFIDQPDKSPTTGKASIYIASPVKDTVTGKTIAVLRTRMPAEYITEVVKNFGTNGDRYHLFDSSKSYFVVKDKDDLGLNVLKDFPGVAHLMQQKVASEVMADSENHRRLVAYTTVGHKEGLPDLNWGVLLTSPTEIAFAAQRSLLLAIILGSAVAALLVSTIAAHLARRATQPVLDAASVVEKLGQGELETRIAVAGEDELATLGSNINKMAEQIQTLLVEQEQAAQQQLFAQTEIALQQTEFAMQQKQQNEALQQELLQLLSGVEAASSGDLTVRAEISAGEIGIVADFFNSIVESLRDVVTQVKQSTTQVNTALGADEGAMRELAEESLRQAKKIKRILDSVEEMSLSIQDVATSAKQAAEVARQASTTAEVGGAAIDSAVQSILHLRETVAETAKKVKRLGESSQQISKVVSLINQIALQTNLLAINASIEAARAGEEGRGFAVVAEEVGGLAARSAAATKDIEQIVENIQRETNEVVDSMETGTAQVVEGTHLVENTKKNLEQILEVSQQIDQLVQSISTATVSQAKTSQTVNNLMKEIAKVSERTSESSRQISDSLQQTVGVAQQLQESVDTFKVEAA